MKKFNTDNDRLESIEKRGNLIKESFKKEFNKIKRVDEDFDWSKYEHKLSDEELDALGKDEADYEDRATRANLGEGDLEELDTNTYAKQMNSTGDWPWAKHLDKSSDPDTNPKHQGNKQQRVNQLSKEGFDKAFYKKYPVGQVKINTNKGEYAFDAMSHGANHTFYKIIFKSTSEHSYLFIENDKGSPKGYYIKDKSIELDEQSSNIVLDMLKYNNTSRE